MDPPRDESEELQSGRVSCVRDLLGREPGGSPPAFPPPSESKKVRFRGEKCGLCCTVPALILALPGQLSCALMLNLASPLTISDATAVQL